MKAPSVEYVKNEGTNDRQYVKKGVEPSGKLGSLNQFKQNCHPFPTDYDKNTDTFYYSRSP